MTMIAKVKKNPTDPLGILVAGIIQIIAAMGLFSKLEMDADQIAQVGSGLLMVAATIRFMMTKHEDETPAAQDSSTEAPEEPEKAPEADPEVDKDTVTAAPPKDPEAPAEEDSDKDDKAVVPPPPSVG